MISFDKERHQVNFYSAPNDSFSSAIGTLLICLFVLLLVCCTNQTTFYQLDRVSKYRCWWHMHNQ